MAQPQPSPSGAGVGLRTGWRQIGEHPGQTLGERVTRRQLVGQIAQRRQRGFVLRIFGQRLLEELGRVPHVPALRHQQRRIPAPPGAFPRVLHQIDERQRQQSCAVGVARLSMHLHHLLDERDLVVRRRPFRSQRLAVGGERLRTIVDVDEQVAETLVGLAPLPSIGGRLGNAPQVAGRLLLLATFEGEVGERPKRVQVAAAQVERRFVELDGPLGVAQLDFGLRRVRQGVRHLLGVEGRVGMVAEPSEMERRLPPPPRSEPVFSQRELRQQLAGPHPFRLHELAVSLVELPELLVHFGETLEQLRRLLGLAAQPPHRLAEAMLRVLPLAFFVEDVRDGQDGRQVVGDQRQRLVEKAHGLGAVGKSLPGRSGQVGEHRGSGRRIFGHFQLARQHTPRLFPVGLAGVQSGEGPHGLRVRGILA